MCNFRKTHPVCAPVVVFIFKLWGSFLWFHSTIWREILGVREGESHPATEGHLLHPALLPHTYTREDWDEVRFTLNTSNQLQQSKKTIQSVKWRWIIDQWPAGQLVAPFLDLCLQPATLNALTWQLLSNVLWRGHGDQNNTEVMFKAKTWPWLSLL